MAGGELLGWMAAGLTLVTFSMRSMIALRTAAVAANICFILYATLNDLYPVLGLHLLLLPCNLFRIRQLLSVAPSRGDRDAEAPTVPTDLTKAAAPVLAAEDAGTGRDSLVTRTCELEAPAMTKQQSAQTIRIPP